MRFALHQFPAQLADGNKGKCRQKENYSNQQIDHAHLIHCRRPAHIELFAKRNGLKAVGAIRQAEPQSNQQDELPGQQWENEDKRNTLFAAGKRITEAQTRKAGK